MQKVSLFTLVVILCFNFVKSGDYYTTDLLEPDRISSAWIIKKFVDTSAVFHFTKRDSVISGGISFDIPSSRFRRYPKYSTAMSIVKFHKITDDRAIKLAELINEIELNNWGTQKSEQASKLNDDLLRLIEGNKDLHKVLREAFVYLENMFGK